MIKTILKAALVTTALVAGTFTASAKEVVVWWDFLSGGDGVRMKALLDQFNAEHADTIEIQATTLEWGVPFYTKVQTSAAVGEGPDVMTYHLSRLPVSVENGTLAEITDEDLASVGLSQGDYAAGNIEAAKVDGTLYAVPFDMHPIVLYYNKDILAAAGLIGADGLPAGLDGAENFSAAMAKAKEAGAEWGMANFTANGDFQSRTIYSLLGQQDGVVYADGEVLPNGSEEKLAKALALMASWVTDGYIPAQTDYPAALALFTSGKAAFHINGVWEVPTLTDLAAAGNLGFEWGAIELPVFFDHAATYADSHAFAIPVNAGKTVTPEKKAAVLEVISWMNKHSLSWATAGHIPAYMPVTQTPEYQAMQPQATYAVLAQNVVFDARTPLGGVASPIQEAAGNNFTGAVNGEQDAAEAAAMFASDLGGL
jgi:multiple sugar transport system substrate-binding protein